MGCIKNTILIVNQYFYPGYKAGGPIQALYHLCQALQTNYKVKVYTTDRDALDTHKYEQVTSDTWSQVDEFMVLYSSAISFFSLMKTLRAAKPSLVYINSFFSPLSIRMVLLGYIFRAPNYVIASRGELTEAALSIKFRKKIWYLRLFKLLKCHKRVIFHVTSEYDYAELKKIFGHNVPAVVIRDLVQAPQKNIVYENCAKKDEVKILSVCRVSIIKNIDFFFSVLQNVESTKKIIYDIYGPIEDKAYYRKLMKMVDQLNQFPHIKCSFHGEVAHSEIISKLKQYDLFVLPSKSENFGYAIYEALANGLPILVANTTPWLEVNTYQAGYVLPLEQETFVMALQSFLSKTRDECIKMRENALRYSQVYYAKDRAKQEMIDFFNSLI